MKTLISQHSFILAYAGKARAIFDRAIFTRWVGGILATVVYMGAWVMVWNPFTWFISGLMVFSSLIVWLEDRKNPYTYQALLAVWVLFPFQMLAAFWIVGGLK